MWYSLVTKTNWGYDKMAKKSWWRLPYVAPVLFGSLAWLGGSTGWYICQTQGLCGASDGTQIQQTTNDTTISTLQEDAAALDSVGLDGAEAAQPAEETAEAPAESTSGQAPDTDSQASTEAPTDAPQPTGIKETATANQPPAGPPSLQNIYFQPDSAISIHDMGLNEVVRYLQENPEATVTASGYYANVPSFVDGDTLSQQRADVVRDTLVGLGIEADRITAASEGADTTADPTKPTDLANARRVELIINAYQ